MTNMVEPGVGRREWPIAVQIAAFVVTTLSAMFFMSGLFLTLPVSIAALIVGIIARPELGRLRVAVIVLAAVGILLAVGWLSLSLDFTAFTGGTEGDDAELRQGTIDR